MGTKLAPSFANIFMGWFEEKFVYSYSKQPLIWKPYIDDVFLIWHHGKTELDLFIRHLNDCHKTIKFTEESSRLHPVRPWMLCMAQNGPHLAALCTQSIISFLNTIS